MRISGIKVGENGEDAPVVVVESSRVVYDQPA